MPTPESVAAILGATKKDPGLRLELLSWFRRTAVPRGQELHSFIGMLIAIVAVAISAAVSNPLVGLGIAGFCLLSFWFAVASTDFLINLGERNRHATAWQAALEDAIAAEAAARRPWWKRR